MHDHDCLRQTHNVRIIDAHHHLWDPSTAYYPLLHGPSRDVQRRRSAQRYLAADYQEDVRGFDVSASVHVEAAYDPDDPVGETRWLAGQAQLNGIPAAMVAHADLRAADLADVLDAHLAYPAVRGIRQMLDIDPRGAGPRHDALNDDAWLAGLRLVAERGLCFLAQVETARLERLAGVLSGIPNLTVVICHAGLRGDGALRSWQQWVHAMERLAEIPGVVVTVSGLAGLLPRWDHALAVKVTRTVLEIVGPDRAMFGSNFPVDRGAVTFDRLVAAACEACAGLPASGREAFLQGTARRIYQLDGHP